MKKWFSILLFAASSSAFAWEQTAPLPLDRCVSHNPYGWAGTTKASN
jgi:hypothetical protein